MALGRRVLSMRLPNLTLRIISPMHRATLFLSPPQQGRTQPRTPGSMRAWALLVFSDDQGRAWEALPHAVRTGEHAFRHIFGADIWTRLAARPEAARLFDEAMQGITQGANGPLITNYPFEKFGWIV